MPSAGIHKLYVCAITFSPGLNGVQIDAVNRENDSQSSRKTQFIASKLVIAYYSPCILTSECTITLQTSTSYIYAIVFSARLINSLQVDQENKGTDSWTSAYSKLVASKLVGACNTCVHLSGCGLTIHTMSGIHEQKPWKCSNKNVIRLWRQFWGRNLPGIACIPHQIRKDNAL